MNDEIREILDEPKILQLSYGCYISLTDYFKLRDYITNLQKEKEDYKSRCENAYEELTYMSSSDYVEDYDIKQKCWIKLSNILQNGSDSE